MSAAASLRRSVRSRRPPAHLQSVASPASTSASLPTCLASSPSSSQLYGGSSDGDNSAATPAHSGKASKAGQRRQQRMASHPYKSLPVAAAAVSHLPVCDSNDGVSDVVGVGYDDGMINFNSEWSSELTTTTTTTATTTATATELSKSALSSSVHSTSQHCTDFDAATAMFDESVCVSPFTMHSLPKLPNVLLFDDVSEEVCCSEPLSPLSTSSMDDSVFTSMSSTVQSSRSVSIASSSSSAATDSRPRCPYPSTPAALQHHDHVLGRSLYHHPSQDTTATQALNRIFAMMSLAVLCTGVELPSVLEKWDDVYSAFDQFDYLTVAAYGEKEIDRLKKTKNVPREKTKINAIIQNANAIRRMEVLKPGSFIAMLWSQHTTAAHHADHFPEVERVLPVRPTGQPAPLPVSNDQEVNFAAARTAVVVADGFSPSRAILRLKLLLTGTKFKRLGDAACLQFAQSIGLVNHHTHSCYCWQHCEDEYQQVIALRQAM